jgi:hypothetical protein
MHYVVNLASRTKDHYSYNVLLAAVTHESSCLGTRMEAFLARLIWPFIWVYIIS